jgi:phosphatidylinositol alpha-1,6-mannosyltransferase
VVVCAGSYPENEARRLVGATLPPVVQVPPGVDPSRFVPLDASRRKAVRARFGLPQRGHLVTSVGRLVPRKGIDVLIEAVARCTALHPNLTLAIAGEGRDAGRLRRHALRDRARVHFLGRIDEAAKVDLLGASDLFAQPCRTRWHGLEQEGFGIVFLEAAACAVPQIAGRSGGSFEAVDDATTGLVVDRPGDARAVAGAITALLGDDERRLAMGAAARRRAVERFDYDQLAARLTDGLAAAMGDRPSATS